MLITKVMWDGVLARLDQLEGREPQLEKALKVRVFEFCVAAGAKGRALRRELYPFAAEIGHPSTHGLRSYVNRLVEEGYLYRDPRLNREDKDTTFVWTGKQMKTKPTRRRPKPRLVANG